jgi:hypothetical protein
MNESESLMFEDRPTISSKYERNLNMYEQKYLEFKIMPCTNNTIPLSKKESLYGINLVNSLEDLNSTSSINSTNTTSEGNTTTTNTTSEGNTTTNNTTSDGNTTTTNTTDNITNNTEGENSST